ncbi:MAG: PLP-dependent transferase [Planctomycetales bacterium]|nr:PLP-dependent transferase [Planctomycetales bacterium]
MSEERELEDPQTPPESWPDEQELFALSGSLPLPERNIPQASAISMAGVWQFDSPDEAEDALAGASNSFVYRRDGHPNERELSLKLAALHGGAGAMLTAQGMSALAAIAWTVLEPGSKVWIGQEMYGKTHQLFTQDLKRWNVTTRPFDPSNEADVEELAAAKCSLVIVETISNPRLRVPDLQRVSNAAHSAGALLVVDNTFASHLLCRPLSCGADLVVESLSKQVNGHSDAMLGLVTGNDKQVMEEIRRSISTFGLASNPLDCYMTNRGLASMAIRMKRACENALAISQALASCDRVEVVDYPGLASHADHGVAQRQFCGGFGWMLSFRLAGDRTLVGRLFRQLKPEINFVPSLGDIVTTVSHPASTSHRTIAKDALQQLGISEGTVRVSSGVEPTAWLVKRFAAALESI